MKILFVGEAAAGSTSLQRFEAMRSLGHELHQIATRRVRDEAPDPLQILTRVQRKLYRMGLPSLSDFDFESVNRSITRIAPGFQPDVIWLDKALVVTPATFAEIRKLAPGVVIVGFSPDDMGNRFNRSSSFDRTVGLFDAYFTTKTYNVAELQAEGCAETHFIANGYDPDTHRPLVLSADERKQFGGGIGFIGTYEAERSQELDALAEAGFPVRIWGHAWPAKRPSHDGLTIEGRAIYGMDYCRAINSFDINLAFLCKRNRDLQTTRSIEIPACGAFMLAERTVEHLDLFEEGKEAEFFATREEMIDKCRYYLAHPEQRKEIARAGYERCVSSGYSNVERMRWMLAQVERLRSAKAEDSVAG